MYSSRLFPLLIAALAFISASDAHVRYNARGLMVRQDDSENSGGGFMSILPGEGSNGNKPSSSSDAGPTATASDHSTSLPTEETSTSSAGTTEEPSSTQTSESPSPTPTDSPSSEPPPSSTETTSEEPPSTTPPEQTSTKDEETTSSKHDISTSVATVTRTNSDGSRETMTSSHVTTSTPEPQGSDSSGSSGGMSKNTRNTVIGVVVGVGGAILLGALGVVAWRIRSRKKQAEESDHLMEFAGGYTQVDKSEPPSSAAGGAPSSSGRSPFQSTLENYHNPAQVNASSNF